ncbi:MAG: bifunctional glutamate N-acetyltransferase/amino-acid acetyltransferase ArgJ [Chloroflexi bacterium]|nr:bifunctional glutamate N-acetyltransferase/amino-acid acetyltransferase ArgJ [Chloroflexota bacterium]
MVELSPGGGITSARGFWAGASYCGIKTEGKDLALVYSEGVCSAAGVFTANKVKAAPVLLTQQRAASGLLQAVVVNSGNANACTGEVGYQDALEMARLAAERTGIAEELVAVCSTGVIGVKLPIEKVRCGIAQIELSRDGGHQAASGIITTDTTIKEAAARVGVGNAVVTVGGMAKGSGMIHPNLATMLAFISTDAALDPACVGHALKLAVDRSFNMITVDGDTSTNDTVLLLANGVAGNQTIVAETPEAELFQAALDVVVVSLAQAVVRDGEGASKFVEVVVRGALSVADARKAARAVAGSNLVKTAIYGSDPNWGRILAAVGYSGAEVNPDVVDIAIGDAWLMVGGIIQPFDRAYASSLLSRPEVAIVVDLHLEGATATAWGCDLTERYVEINAKYTT